MNIDMRTMRHLYLFYEPLADIAAATHTLRLYLRLLAAAMRAPRSHLQPPMPPRTPPALVMRLHDTAWSPPFHRHGPRLMMMTFNAYHYITFTPYSRRSRRNAYYASARFYHAEKRDIAAIAHAH